jgi:predicted nuclease with RNAse H fold
VFRTVGIDLAAEAERTGLAVLDWQPDGAVLRDLARGADDDAIIAAVTDAAKVGLDCPLGWPDDFVAFVADHHAGRLGASRSVARRAGRRSLAWRMTDKVVRHDTGLLPLSVAADRIGHAAIRCAGLLARLAADGAPVDRTGAGVVVEVYPAAALKSWGLPHRGYKRPGDAARLGQVVDQLLAAAPWLHLADGEAECRRSHDALDAVIAGLAARAASAGLVTRPDGAQAPVARREGWIAVPTAPLSKLDPTARSGR